MLSTIGMFLLSILMQSTPIELTSITIVNDSDFDLPLSPFGEAELRRKETVTRVKVKVNRLDPFSAFGNSMRAYVVWAVSPEGDFENLGELEVDGRKAEVETATLLQRFGILITAEPHFMVETPSAAVAFMSRAPRNNNVRSEQINVNVGAHDYSGISLPPQGSLHSRIVQARAAFEVARQEDAERLAEDEFRQARVAFDSMEELLRRTMPLDVLLPYVNDSIRLSHRSVRAGRAEVIQNELVAARRRADNFVRRSERLEQEVERMDQRQNDTEQRMEGLQSDLQDLRRENRQLDVERAEALRGVRATQGEIDRLRDPWPRLRQALLAIGARPTARGLLLTLPADRFESDSSDFEDGTPEALARLAGVLAFGETPPIRIEGHTDDSGPASRSLTLSEERAEAVKTFLVEAGIPEDFVRAEGFGSSRPIVRAEDDENRELNERVEIIVREFQG